MKIVVALAVFAVILILLAGITVMIRGGDVNARHANKLMQLRVAAQAIVVVLIMAALWFGANGSE